MRWLLACALLIIGCDMGERRPKPTPEPTPTPTPQPAPDPAPAFVELIHSVPTVSVTVSSQVKNPKILPAHLIDHDMQTAWNSRTGRLAGSWIEVKAPGSRIREVRMTVGHTGKGPRGQDYFTMNPRIAKIAIDSSVEAGRIFTFDPASREPQTFTITPAEWVRITIVELRPGSKESWREVAVSELEVWGTPPPDWRQGAMSTPVVHVGDELGDFCTQLEAINKERDKIESDEHGCVVPGPARCDEEDLEVRDLVEPWPQPTYACDSYDTEMGPTTCWVTLETATSILLALPPVDTGNPKPSPPDAYMKDIVKGGAPELVIRNSTWEPKPEDAVVICRAEPLSCTKPEPVKTAFSHPPIFQ